MFQRSFPLRGFARIATLAHHGCVSHAIIVGGRSAGVALAKALSDFREDRVGAAFQDYFNERRPEVEEAQAFQRAVAKVGLQQRWWFPTVAQAARRLQVPPVRRWVEKQAARTMLHGICTVELRV